MRVSQLEIFNFRNFKELHLTFNNKCNVLVGDNGQGKTNILESIYLLGRGQSFRPTETSSLINFENLDGGSIIKAAVHHEHLTSTINCTLNGKNKKIFFNGKKALPVNLITNLPIVLFSPESLSSIKGGGQERRSLIDEIVLLHQPENMSVIQAYVKALRTRNKVLKDYKNGLIGKAEFSDVFDSLSQPFLTAACDLTFVRLSAIRQISEEFNAVLKMISNVSHETQLLYKMSSKTYNSNSIKEVHDAIYNRMLELNTAEISTATSLVGPHRHDIEIQFDGKNSRFYCSQGQQRSLILALKFAQIMYHYRVFKKYPILLLDDVLSELDLGKKMNLLDLVGQVNAQVFLTTTDQRFRERLSTDKYTVFEIGNGTITSKRD